MEKKPHIIIELNPHLQDFLYHEFKANKKDDVTINLSSNIGKFIHAMVTLSDRPIKVSEKGNPIRIFLPIQEYNHYLFSHHFIYIPKWKEKMIQDFLESNWRIRVREYFVTGYEKGFSQDKIICSFLMAYNIKKNKITYDQIKKIDYRNRTKIHKEIAEEIQLSLFE